MSALAGCMLSRARGLAVASMALVAMHAGQSRAEMPPPVFVSGAEEGQGFLMTRLDACYAVTAGHVMLTGREPGAPSRSDATIVGSGTPAVNGHGRLVGLDRVADVAVLKIDGQLTRRCGLDFVAPVDPARLRGATGLVVYAFEDGTLGSDQVDIVDLAPEVLQVAAARTTKERGGLPAGRSGSLLEVAGSPAGMLLLVVNQGADAGIGRVLRYDALMRSVRTLLEHATPEPVASVKQPQAAATASRNFADGTAGARIAYWSAQPTRPELHAGNLLDSQSGAAWEASAISGLIDIDIELAGGQVHAVSSVEILGPSDIGLQPDAVEVYVGTDGNTWSSVGNIDWNSGSGSGRVDFTPRRARFVRLHLAKPMIAGAAARMSLKRVIVY